MNEALRSSSIRELVDCWIEYTLSPEDSPAREERFWAYERFCEVSENEPDLAWQAILEVLARDPDDKTTGMLAAGPLEDLLVFHGESVIERVETEARRHPAFRHLLGGVWQNETPDDIWKRVQAVAGARW